MIDRVTSKRQSNLLPALAVAGIVEPFSPLNPNAPTNKGYETCVYPVADRLSHETVGVTSQDLHRLIIANGSNAVLIGSFARSIGVGCASMSGNHGIESLFGESYDTGPERANSIYHFAPAILFPTPKRYNDKQSDLDIVVFNQSELPTHAVPCRSIPGACKIDTTLPVNRGSLNVSYLFAPPHMSTDTPWMNWVNYFSICASDSCVVAGQDGKLYVFLPSGEFGTIDRSVDAVFSPKTKLDPRLGMWGVRHGVYMAYFSAINGVNLGYYGIYDMSRRMIVEQDGQYPDGAYQSLGELLCKTIPACMGNEPRNMISFQEELDKMGLMGVIEETVHRHGLMVGFNVNREPFTLDRLYKNLIIGKSSCMKV